MIPGNLHFAILRPRLERNDSDTQWGQAVPTPFSNQPWYPFRCHSPVPCQTLDRSFKRFSAVRYRFLKSRAQALLMIWLILRNAWWSPQCRMSCGRRWGYVFDKLGAAVSFTYQNTSVCFYGHTHLPLAFIRDGSVHGGSYSKLTVEPGRKYFINVGSVGEPRDGNPLAAYVTYELSRGCIELRRVAYDAAKTESKVQEAGLPRRRQHEFLVGAPNIQPPA